MMNPSSLFSLLLLFLLHSPLTTTANSTVYLSKTTFFSDYSKMLTHLKIFIYPLPLQQQQQQQQNNTTIFSLLHNSLLTSNFLTLNPNEATLFFLPFLPTSTRSLSRHIDHIRTSYSYWDRSLGADHFYFSCNGVGPTSTRNVVELKKNALQISCFPSPAREFIPHKDVTVFSPLLVNPRASLESPPPTRFLGYWRFVDVVHSGVDMINGLRNDPDFLIESEPSDGDYDGKIVQIRSSKFCLFVYDGEGVVGLSVAIAYGCVPVVITDRPIQDLPFMDVIKWSEIALFVKSTVKSKEFKRVLMSACEDGAYEKMRRLGVTIAHHFAWNESSLEPYDAFYMVMYQLWLRRHAIRYAKWDMI
ncbi:probable glycosyltransferase At5g11130 [Beta vulgaris subsp. vulgaris]|uniref:probable glycosyltransferase At5g11130 n=1 Tax=Beta vulgaris subsp. vulgaris TaxID=3555 RepID=UPI002036943B|nr:probable glycosyltransferase At5g11130 [Beta vulgaris subsp. vulgaris]